MKQLCKMLLLLSFVGAASCKEDYAGGEPENLTFGLTDSIESEKPVILISDETYKAQFLAEHANEISTNGVPAGWTVSVSKDSGYVAVTAPSASSGADQTFSLQLTAKGENGQTATAQIDFYHATFDDPKGALVLNEGNMTSENGSLLYITPEGYMINNAYKRVNGTELGNVPQDMYRYDGKLYIISQNGNGNATGAEFENDGMLIVADARSLKKSRNFLKEEFSQLDWPTHIAVIDEQHIYIRDNRGVWRLNMEDLSLTFIEGTESAPKAPFAVVGGKVYTYYNRSFNMTGLLEITPGNDRATDISVPFYSLYGITGIAPADNDCLWIMSSKFGGEISMNLYDPSAGNDGKLKRNYISELPSEGSSGRSFTAQGNTIYYASGTAIYRLVFNPDAKTGSKDPQDEMLVDLSYLDDNAAILYNGLGVNPTTGYVYANTLKGVGPFYTTNQIWVFNFSDNVNAPLFKFENYTRFPAGFFFNY